MTDDISADQTDDERRSEGLSPKAHPAGEPSPGSFAPILVKISFWLWVAGVTVLLLTHIIFLIIQDRFVDAAVSRNTDARFTDQQVTASTIFALWIAFVASVVFGALIVLFAYKAREGTRSARNVLVVLAVLTTLFYALLFDSQYAILAVLLFLIALLLMYLPSVQAYFPKVGRKLI